MRPLDLRSDTVTRPSAEMRRAMAEAEVGDDVYGEDPTVQRLEARVAEMLGKEAALFTSSGTMANQLAIGLHCRPGDEVIAEAGSHCLNFESGAMAALWGVQARTVAGDRGLFDAEDVTRLVRPIADVYLRSRLLCVENTHNRGGGTVWPLDRYTRVVEAGRRAGLAVHLDGVRLFNAQVASGVPARRYAELADTVSICFSKGLGAPVGSALCGPRELIRQARVLRKRLGGGMRQVGILAAAALWALEHNIDRLVEDHRSARCLAEILAELPGVRCDVERVETNMVFAEFPEPASEACAKLASIGILANPEGSTPRMVRMVTHLDAPLEAIEAAAPKLRECWRH